MGLVGMGRDGFGPSCPAPALKHLQISPSTSVSIVGAQWLSGRVLDSRQRAAGLSVTDFVTL